MEAHAHTTVVYRAVECKATESHVQQNERGSCDALTFDSSEDNQGKICCNVQVARYPASLSGRSGKYVGEKGGERRG